MKAADVMTTNVVTVGPEASVREVAGILLARHISAVPLSTRVGHSWVSSAKAT